MMVSARAAAAHVGVAPPEITKAIKAGKIQARERIPGKRCLGLLIDLREVESWHAERFKPVRFTDDEIEALLELSRTCTWEQVGAYLGRSAGVCSNKAIELREKGFSVDRSHTSSGRSIPWRICRTAILLAKTCPRCGVFRDVSQFPKNNGGSNLNYSTHCRLCSNKQLCSSDSRRRQRENVELLNEITTHTAVNSGLPYTAADDVVLKDKSISTFEAALKLGRTFNGVKYRRDFLGVRFTDRKCTRKVDPEARWHIDFPNAMQALQDHFRELGKAVPEDLWEWNDEEEMAS